MKKKTIFLAFILFIVTAVAAQTEIKKGEKYYNVTQISMLMGMERHPRASDELQISPSVTMVNGYQLTKGFGVGLGVGYEMFDNNLFPIFADFRRTYSTAKISPFFTLKTGYAIGNLKTKHYDDVTFNYLPYQVIDADVRYYGGLMFQPEFGIKLPASDNADILFTVAYRYQKNITRVKTEWDRWDNHENLNRLSFGIGIMFK
jgi:hypothetical protein